MAKEKKQDCDTKTTKVDSNSLEWNDYVLGLLSEDEKIDGNPTTDGLRRIFEIALDCTVVESTSNVVQAPDPNNEKRATVVHTIGYILNNSEHKQDPMLLNMRTVSGAADVYWGNCDKVYRNHPVAVAETRAEGRALRRGLKLRKVVAAEELAKNIEDDPSGDNVDKISEQQINFIDVMSKRSNINIKELLLDMSIDATNIKNISHDTAVSIIRELSKYQQNLNDIPSKLVGYDNEWR
jgi:putative NIF3 family GTP cyclohydrolase 1 type 2